jgi:hypothetical protein
MAVNRQDMGSIVIKGPWRTSRTTAYHRRHYRLRFCERLERPTVDYANTVNNVVKALMARVYVDCDPFTANRRLLKSLAQRPLSLLASVLREKGTILETPEKVEEALARYPARKAEIYREGLKQELDCHRHSRATTFVKAQPVKYTAADKPRVIQFHGPVFMAHHIPWFTNLEHAICHTPYMWSTEDKFIYSKTFDSVTQMSLIYRKVCDLSTGTRDVLSVTCDCKAYDAHVMIDAIKLNNWFILEVLRRARAGEFWVKRAKDMLQCYLRHRCRATCDDGEVSYTVQGEVISGSRLTSWFALLQIAWIWREFVTAHKIPDSDWRLICAGDDFTPFLKKKWEAKVALLPSHFLRHGHTLVVEDPALVDPSNLEGVEFCQARPVRVGEEWRLVRDPYKVYMGYSHGAVHYRTLQYAQRFWATVSQAELILGYGVPVHQHLFAMFHRLSEDAKPLESVARRYWLRNCHRVESKVLVTREIAWGTRDSYAKAFGIDVADQLSIEGELDAWTVSHIPAEPLDQCLESGWHHPGVTSVDGSTPIQV